MSDKFDPSKYLRPIKTRQGMADYLDVKYRLLWLRSDHPEATIETEMMVHLPDEAIFRARVTLPSGAFATGWGSETRADFPAGHLEKAETKAIGRALAALGFGVQFVGDELDEGERIVDSGVPARPIGWTEVWSEARKRGITDREQLAKHLGKNPGGMTPAAIYELLVVEPVAELAGMSAGHGG